MNYFSERPDAITIKNKVPVNLTIKDKKLVNISYSIKEWAIETPRDTFKLQNSTSKENNKTWFMNY